MMDFITKMQRDADVLQKAVEKRLMTPPTATKRTPAIESVAFTFDLRGVNGAGLSTANGLFSPRESNYTNGAEDFYITDVTWAGSMECTPDLLGTTGAYRLDANDQGVFFVSNLPGIQPDTFPFFDFQWNFKTTRDGALYCPGTNGATFLARRSLGVYARGVLLSFADPFRVPAGDTLTWLLRCSYINRANVVDSLSAAIITINLVMLGYRTGRIAEADYERK